MQTVLHPAASRGQSDLGWLHTRYSFSFSNYFNPQRMGFGALRVLNDDVIAPGRGFGRHPHQNMEIITLLRRGVLEHRDSTGHTVVLRTGDVQIMSAGRGIEHAEMNPDPTESVEVFQLWILPKTDNTEPRYAQRNFPPDDRQNRLQPIVAPLEAAQPEALGIHQEAYLWLGHFTIDQPQTYTLRQPGQGVYIFVIEGQLTVDQYTLGRRDALGLTGCTSFEFQTQSSTEVLLIEVPMP